MSEPEKHPKKHLPLKTLIKEFFAHFFGGIYVRADQHHIFLLSGGLAFSLFVCIVPLVLIIFSIAGSILEKPSIADDINIFIDRAIPYQEYADFVKEKVFARVDEFKIYKGIAGVIGFIGIFFASSGLFSAMRTTLNLVYRVNTTQSVIVGKLRDFGLVLLVLIYFLISTAILPAIQILESFASNHEFIQSILPGFFQELAFGLLSFAVILTAFLVIYWLIPQGKIPGKTVFISGLSAAILWEVARQVFDFYITNAITLKKVYGAYVFIVVVAFWVYYSAIVFIIGAEIGQLYRDWKRRLKIMYKKYD